MYSCPPFTKECALMLHFQKFNLCKLPSQAQHISHRLTNIDKDYGFIGLQFFMECVAYGQ